MLVSDDDGWTSQQHPTQFGFDDHFPSTALLKAAVLGVVTASLVSKFQKLTILLVKKLLRSLVAALV